MQSNDKPTPVQLGGSIETSLSQSVPLNVSQLFAEGWKLTRHTKFALLAAIVGVGCCIVLVSMLIHSGSRMLNYPLSEPGQLLIINLLLAMVFSPMTAALSMMGITHASGLATRATLVFDFFRFLAPLANCTLVAMLVSEVCSVAVLNVGLPPFLSLMLSLYFMVCFSFAAPLVIEKRMSSLRAMAISFRVVNRQFTGVVVSYALLAALLLVALLPLGLGLIWGAPMFFNVKGVLYRQLFGVRLTLAVNKETGTMAA